MCLSYSFVILVILLLNLNLVHSAGRRRKNGVINSRHITVLNESGSKVDVFWIHPKTRELAASNTDGKGITYGGATGIASFVTHSFEVQEMEPCKSKRCKKGYFTVSANEDQIFKVLKDFSVDAQDHKSEALRQARKALKESCPVDYSVRGDKSALERFDSLVECLRRQMDTAVDEREKEVQFQADVRHFMGGKLANYACSDPKLNTTVSLYNDTMVDGQESYLKQVIFFNDQGSRLLLFDDMISPDETVALVKASESGEVGSDVHAIHKRLAKTVWSSVGDKFALSSLQLTTLRPSGGSSLSVSVDPGSEAAPHSSIFVFTDSNGAIHFPRLGVHINSAPGLVLIITYGAGDSTDSSGYLGEYKVCFTDESQQMTVMNDDLRSV